MTWFEIWAGFIAIDWMLDGCRRNDASMGRQSSSSTFLIRKNLEPVAWLAARHGR